MKKAWDKWKSFAEKAGAVQANVVFSAIYYIFIIPIGFTVSIFKDSLDIKEFPVWSEWESQSGNMEELREQ